MPLIPNTKLVYHTTRSEENPYAWDIADNFTGEYPLQPFDELGWKTVLLSTSYLLSNIFGGLLCFTMLYLVSTHTKGKLKPYKKMLLTCAVSDLIFWTFDTCADFRAKEDDGVYIVVVNGAAKNFDRFWQLNVLCLFVWSFVLVNVLLPAQAYFRYYYLKNRQALSPTKSLFVFSIALLASFPHAFYSRMSFDLSANEWPDYNYANLWYNEFPLPKLLIANIDSIYVKMYLLTGVVTVNIAYVFLIYFGKLTLNEINKQKYKYSTNTTKLQRQLTIFLSCQAVITFCTSVIPVTFILIPLIFRFKVNMTPYICLACFSWIPMLNPLMTLIVIAPYRRVVLKTVQVKSAQVSFTDSSS